MRADGAVVLPFPAPARALLAALGGGGVLPAASPAADPPAPGGLPIWAAGMASAAPLLLAPQAGSSRDVAATVLVVLGFGLVA